MSTDRSGTPRRGQGALAMLLAAGLAWACVTRPEPPSRVLAGCYYFERDEVAEDLALPWGVRLLDEPLEGWPALEQEPDVGRALTLRGPDEATAYPFGYWRPLTADSVEIGYPAGGGLLLQLAVTPTHLVGTATPVGDVLPPDGRVPETRSHPVALLRARCPGE